MSPASFHLMPESWTAITTSERPVSFRHAISTLMPVTPKSSFGAEVHERIGASRSWCSRTSISRRCSSRRRRSSRWRAGCSRAAGPTSRSDSGRPGTGTRRAAEPHGERQRPAARDSAIRPASERPSMRTILPRRSVTAAALMWGPRRHAAVQPRARSRTGGRRDNRANLGFRGGSQGRSAGRKPRARAGKAGARADHAQPNVLA